MFTVLVRFHSDGREQLLSVKSINYHPKEGLHLDLGNSEIMHFATAEKQGATKEGLYYADVYVMNKEGKTVARYVL